MTMQNNHTTSRRQFLKTTLTLPVAAAVPGMLLSPSAVASAAPAEKPAATAGPLPMRKLGRSGRQATILSLGGMMSALTPDYLDTAWAMGIRYFDTSSGYLNGKSEKIIGEWLAKHPERREELFLATKNPAKQPQQLLEAIDRRLEACGTKYLDAFYIHGISPKKSGEDTFSWPKSDEFKRVADQLKSSGKVKMVGFSCHDGRLNDYLTTAAEGGFVDIIMLSYQAFFKKGDAFDRALDACHAKGIALVAMKTMRNSKDIPARLPELDKLSLTTHQAVLHAVWSDPRIASICNAIQNVAQMEASTAAARSYKKPLPIALRELLQQTILASNRHTFCPGCPACDAFAAGSTLALKDISRAVTYYEQDGDLTAGDLYRRLPESSRAAAGANLAELRDRCAYRVDYPALVKRAERYFA